MRPARALRGLRSAVLAPRTSVRWRLTLLYGVLFLVCGVALLAVTYALVEHATVSSGPGRAITFIQGNPRPLQGNVGTNVRGTISVPPQLRRALSSKAGKAVVHQVGAQQRISDLHQLQVESLIALAIMALLSTGLGWLVAGRVLRPLRTITSTTREISAANLHERLAMAGPRDELRQLADTIDGLLERLEGAFDLQRRFVANASHELRTPLTATRAVVEMVLSDPHATEATFREACEQVLDESQHQEQLIDALLTLAHGQRGLARREPVQLDAIARTAVDAVGAEAVVRDVAVHAELASAAAGGDQRLVERLVVNLVENAVRHNVPGGAVWVCVRTTADGRAVLGVSNTGAAVPNEDVPGLLQPFRRLAGDRTGYRDGLGLGLSIVEAIAAAHEARLEISARAGGGLDVEVSFDAAPVTAAAPAQVIAAT